MFHRVALLGCPGASKSTCGLSYPGVEQHVWGSSEEDTALNFASRTDILKPLKMDWFESLTEAERAKFTDEKVSEIEVGNLTRTARARNIAKYRRYLYGLKSDLLSGKRKEVQTIFLDNGTPFSQDFEDYVKVVYAAEFTTKEGNFNSIAFAIKYQNEITDFMRMFYELPCHTIVSFHISMTVDEQTAAQANFMSDTAKGIKHQKEWQPLIMGKTKYVIAGIPTFAFYLWVEEAAGQRNKYYAKLEADSNTVGLAKSRVQPFDNPLKIELVKNGFYQQLTDALAKKGGK